jgi:hypothetical protein
VAAAIGGDGGPVALSLGTRVPECEELKMDNSEIASQITRVILGELDDRERAIKANNPQKALRELDDAVTKLRRLAAQLR